MRVGAPTPLCPCSRHLSTQCAGSFLIFTGMSVLLVLFETGACVSAAGAVYLLSLYAE